MTVILVFICIGAGGNATNANAEHHTANEVQTVKNNYLNEKSKNKELMRDDEKQDQKEAEAKSEKDKILVAYNQMKPQFKQEADQKKQQEEQQIQAAEAQKQQQRQAAEAQKQQQRQAAEAQKQQQRQAAEAQKQQQEQQQRQAQAPTPAGNPQYSNNQQGRMVWIAPKSGRKYHYDQSCRGLRRANGNIQQISEQQAKYEGYTLCGFE
ncbi:hypothetical protein GYW21_05095 [Lactobacillus mellis]|nr:hypothetical protein [Bombilactobacillus mellis]